MEYEPLEPGYYYHIYNQGNNKENIFIENRNYAYFLSLLKKHIIPHIQVFAYCLLTNHFHLLIRINEDAHTKTISQIFSNFFNAYAKAINKAYGRSGSLFKRKFSRIRVNNEIYLKNLLIYIHTNAQHHGLVEYFDLYQHTSYHAYLSEQQTLVSKGFILDMFEDIANLKHIHQLKSGEIFEKMNEYLLE